MLRGCLVDVPYLLRYEAYTGQIRDIYGTSCLSPRSSPEDTMG
jgi:hypothetical protein